MAIKFTRAQMQGGFVKSDEDYAHWYVREFLPEFFPHVFEITSEYDLVRMSMSGILYARHFRFCSRDEQGMFLTLQNSFGPNFWMFPGFKKIMENQQLTPDEKFDTIFSSAVTLEQKDRSILEAEPDYWFHHLIDNNPYIVSNCGSDRA